MFQTLKKLSQRRNRSPHPSNRVSRIFTDALTPAISSAIEPLEARMMLAFSANINFQPDNADVPRGYRADSGDVFRSVGKRLAFGWNTSNEKNVFDRNARSSRDQRYDTGALLQGRTWEIAVPRGIYSVHIVAGDANSKGGVYRITAEGSLVVSGNASKRHRWFEGRKNIEVTDGRLTITSGSNAKANKINFIELKLVSPQARVSAKDASAAEGGNNTAAFTISRTGSTARGLKVRYTLSGTAQNGADFDSLSGTAVIPKGARSTVITVRPKDDKIAEGTENLTLRITGNNAYALRKGKQATITIADNDKPTSATPTVTISAADASAAEQGRNPGRFNIALSGSTKNALTVNLNIGGSAKNGTDYDALPTKVTIPAGQSSVNVTVTPKDDGAKENTETVVVTLASGKGYKVGKANSATISIADNDATPSQPAAPRITEPSHDDQLLNGADVHMEIDPATDGDATDWEIWTTGANPVRVWRALNVTHEELDNHIHFGDGAFEGPQAGKGKLEPSRTYELRVRIRVDGVNSPYALRTFRTRAEEVATAEGWVARQSGYKIEQIPFTFAEGPQGWRLPTNIAFVPENLRGPHPKDPLFYVTELYGSIRVVTNDFTVYNYATGLLNFNPSGQFSGTGETGLTGITIDPSNGDVYAAMLFDLNGDGKDDTFPKVTRFRSNDGGLHAIDTNGGEAGTQGTDILRILNTADSAEMMKASHIISNISFGPDGKLYVHNGDGFQATRAANLNSFGGKILRMNKDGSAPTDNPFYEAGDRLNDGKPDARDYVWSNGFRNPFGGDWREASGSRPAQLWVVENGPSVDRLSMVVRGQNQLWDGSDRSMRNFNIAYAPGGNFSDGAPDWDPPPAPVNIAFIQNSTYGGSGFPASKLGHAFITQSGPTYASGPNYAKSIEEWVIDDNGNRVSNRELISYEGPGRSTAAGIAAGPDGLYFTTLYPDTGNNPTALGATILRVVYTGASAAPAAAAASPAPDSATERLTEDVIGPPSAAFAIEEKGSGAGLFSETPLVFEDELDPLA